MRFQSNLKLSRIYWTVAARTSELTSFSTAAVPYKKNSVSLFSDFGKTMFKALIPPKRPFL